MSIFRERPRTVDALLWTGANRTEIGKFLTNHGCQFEFDPLSNSLSVVDHLGTCTLLVDYWLVWHGKRKGLECVPDEEFRRKYEPARDVFFYAGELTPELLESLRNAPDMDTIGIAPTKGTEP